jgi:hypothetical protein
MRKISTSFVYVVFLALGCCALHAQSPDAVPAGSNAPATSSPARQAPDKATTKITELVHAGKYVDAQKLTEALLLAYPDDQRLIKAKALIEKMLAQGGSTGAAPAASPAPQPAVVVPAAQLTGMDKVDLNALLLLARQAQQTTDLDEQRKLLKQFMDQSSAFLDKHPEQTMLWQLRAASAISLNDPMAGYEAGQKLLAAGAADSTDPAVQQLLVQLRNKGWLDKQEATAQTRPAASSASGTAVVHFYRLSHMAGEFSQYDIEIDGRNVGKIGNAQSVSEDLSPGKHNINVIFRRVKSDRPLYDMELEAGKEYWIRVDLTDGFVIHMRLAVVPEAEAREESGKLKEITKGDHPGK